MDNCRIKLALNPFYFSEDEFELLKNQHEFSVHLMSDEEISKANNEIYTIIIHDEE